MHSTGFLLVWLVSFKNERLLYLLASDTYLDCIWVYILCSSLHVTAMWILHQACQGFLHGKSLFLLFALAMQLHTLLHFYLSCSIISDWAKFMIGLSDTQSVASAHATKYSLLFARIVQWCSLCYFAKTHGLTTSLYYTLQITVLGYHIDAPDTLCQSFWLSFGSISPRYA